MQPAVVELREQRLCERRLLPARQPTADASPQDAGGVDTVRLLQAVVQPLVRLPGPPVVQGHSIARPQREADQMQPSRLHPRPRPCRVRQCHRRLPNRPQQHRRPLVAGQLQRLLQCVHQPLRLDRVGEVGDDVAGRGERVLVDDAGCLAGADVAGAVGLGGAANIELQPPPLARLDIAAPQLQRADLGHAGLDADDRVPGLRGPLENRADRWQRGHLIGGDDNDRPGRIVQPHRRRVDRKLDRLRQREGELRLLDRDRVVRLQPGRGDAHGLLLPVVARSDADVERPRQPGGDPGRESAARAAVAGGPERDGSEQIVGVEHARPLKPRPDDFKQPVPQQRRGKEAAIEEDMIWPDRAVLPAGPREERRQVPGDRRVGRVRQAELLEAALPVLRHRVAVARRQKPIEQHPPQLVAIDGERPRRGHQARPPRGQGKGERLSAVFGQQLFLQQAALTDEGSEVGRRQRPVGRLERAFQMRRQGCVEVVAAEQQVLADGAALEVDAAVLQLAGGDEREVRRAAADVAHQHRLAGPHPVGPVGVPVHPGVERRLRLLDQHDPRQAGLLGCAYGQLAGDLVEAGRQGDDDLLLGERRPVAVPVPGDVPEDRRGGLDRTDPRTVGLAVPGQDGGRAVDAGMAQPRLRRGDQPSGPQPPEIAGRGADDRIGGVLRREEQKRRQHRRVAPFPNRQQLTHRPRGDRLAAGIGPRDGRVRRAQVDPDDEGSRGVGGRVSGRGRHGGQCDRSLESNRPAGPESRDRRRDETIAATLPIPLTLPPACFR